MSVNQFAADAAFLNRLHENNILLQWNSPAPSPAGYGWMKIGHEIKLNGRIRIEESCGLYGGPYFPLIGGFPSSGLCSIGSFSYSYSSLPEGLTVGRYCSISAGLRFLDSTHPVHTLTTSAMMFRPGNFLFERHITDSVRSFAHRFDVKGGKPYPTIGHDVWIGANVTLGMGITIGTGAIVASCAVVTKNVPPYAIVAGNPAEIKGLRFPDSIIQALLNSQWWDFEPKQVFATDPTQVEAVCERIADGQLDRFKPRAVDL